MLCHLIPQPYAHALQIAKHLGSGSDIDLNSLEEMLKTCLPKVQEAKGKDVVLVIGNTGAGKTTTTDYLIGHAMEKRTMDGRKVVDVKKKSPQIPMGIIGHKLSKAETLYPTVYASSMRDLVF